MGAMGLEKTEDLKPWHLMRRIEAYEIRNLSEIYEFIEEGSLLKIPNQRAMLVHVTRHVR
ncbi:MAG: hypothetical protein Ct9H300mP28_14430 [Pseudomonadota bacterium]|nr:MAG: hypothetical protein Ct9H300mP28_14430 [Pseudomonadota bacterium]